MALVTDATPIEATSSAPMPSNSSLRSPRRLTNGFSKASWVTTCMRPLKVNIKPI